MGWQTSFHNAFASSLISLLAGKLIDLTCTEIGHVWNVDENLRSLATSSQIVQLKLNQLGDDKLPKEWTPWVRDVTKLFYDVDDIIDSFTLDIMEKNHINQQRRRQQQQQINSPHQAHVQDQECTSIMFSTICRNLSGRRERQNVSNHPVPQNENQVRGIIISSLKKWGLPHKISTLLEKLQLIDKQVDGLLQGAGSNCPGRSISVAHTASIRVSIPSSFSHMQGPLAQAREEDKRIIIEKYLLNSSFRGRGVCIVGMSGLGKSTLARYIQNDAKITKFFASVIWASAPGDFNSAANVIIAPSMQGHVANGYPVSQQHRRGRVLFVLDDLWNVQHTTWRNFISTLGAETILLITTRDPKVAFITDTTPYFIKRLSDEDCTELIMKMLPRTLSRKYGRSISHIARKCEGLPLVANLFGLMIPAKCREEWPEEAKAISHFEESDLWELREFRDEIFPALRFEDPCMPPELGKFIAYLYLFPDGHYFRKDELSQLWMAEGFVTEKWTATGLKDAGKYFDDLLSRSMFYSSRESSREDKMGNYRIHEFTRRFAQNIASNMCYQMKDGDLPYLPVNQIRHLSLCCQNLVPYHIHIEKFYSRLRTFLLLPGKGTNIIDVPESFFHKLHYLRVVSLSRSNIIALPRSISTLKHLRHLDASNTPIQSLPDSTCELLGLRVIKLRNCRNLLGLPSKIGNLVNLFHLDVDMARLRSSPRCIGLLTSLQTLDSFTVHNVEGYRITELKNMNNLRGSIKIMKLENVENAWEAENAKLCLKPHLKRLDLHWTIGSYMPEPLISTIVEKLQPNDNLTELRLANYSGSALPSWLSSTSCHLKSIYLYNCPCIIKLPSFWKLPDLKTLYIDAARSVVQLGRQFFGDPKYIRFPQLESLELRNMETLTRWEELIPGDMPRLRVLNFFDCPALSCLPTLRFLTVLDEVEIKRCPSLREEPEFPLSVSSYRF